MKQIYIQLTAQSPLAIRSDHAPGGASGASYIPGTAFIGGLAAVHRMLYSVPEKKEEFEQLFLQGQIHYPDLYPANFSSEGEGLQARRELPVYPVPGTAQSCKRHPGFRFPESEENDGHGVRDSLIDWTLFRLGTEHKHSDAVNALKNYKDCSECHAVMDHFSGYYRRSDYLQEPLEKHSGVAFYPMEKAQESEYTRLQTHTGIDRTSGTVQEGILYNRVVFEEGAHFWGAIRVPDDEKLLSALHGFLKIVGGQGLLRIGTGRTRGMGIVRLHAELVESEEDEERTSFVAFEDRLSGFDGLVHRQMEKMWELQDSRYFFALTLHSPLILCDEFLRYRGTIDGPTLLKDLLHWDGGIKLEQLYQTASVRRMTGWQEIWGTPRINEYAIDTGSVFLFACDVVDGTSEKENLLRKLFELEQQGAGARRTEGFGRVCVSDQFHQERGIR